MMLWKILVRKLQRKSETSSHNQQFELCELPSLTYSFSPSSQRETEEALPLLHQQSQSTEIELSTYVSPLHSIISLNFVRFLDDL